MDEPYADYFRIVYPERITYFPESFLENQYGFGFQKTDEGNILLDKFNQFLSNTNIKEIYDKWNVEDTTKLTIDKNLNTSAETINAAFLMDLNPLCFLEGIEVKGYEIELLYKFAKEYNYNINFMQIDVGERVSYIEEKKANITGGWFTITDERKNSINFSNSIHNAGTVLVTRVDRKKDTLTLKVIDNNFNEKTNNAADVQVKFSDKIKNSSCVFPEKYNDTIIINCTISDLDNIDPYEEGFEFVNTTDKIQLIFSNLELNNFFQANSKISGHENIITESDKSNKVCTSNSNSTSQENSTIKPVFHKIKSSGGISTGAIIGIIIPCVVVLIAAIATAAVCYNKNKVPPSNFNSETVKDFYIKKEHI
jgi:ABC-type amino acid transport substrate-binding protein